jgi:DNA-binding transcriptional LysR family regulator
MDNPMADLRDVNLNRLTIFVAVVEAGSLTAAAARLGLAKTMVSTHMQRLEAEVGASLLVRTTRRLNVTEAGRAFYDASREILRATEAALAAVSGGAGPLRGTLRVSAAVDYGSLVVAPALVALRDAHPELEVDLQCDDRQVDLIAGNLDVAIRLGRLADSNYRAVRIGDFERWLVASPGFVARHAALDTPAAFDALPYIQLSSVPRATLELTHVSGGRATLRCRRAFASNTATACHAAVLAGGGFTVATSFASDEDLATGRLVRLLPGWSLPAGEIHAVFPSTRHPSAKVRALIEVLKARLAR